MTLTTYDITCLSAAKALIDKDPSTHHSIPELSKHAGLSETRLKKGFKEVFGKGVYEYRDNLRLELSVNLLSNTDHTIKKISKLIGFKYTNSFRKAFKKKYGLTPNEWRLKPE